MGRDAGKRSRLSGLGCVTVWWPDVTLRHPALLGRAIERFEQVFETLRFVSFIAEQITPDLPVGWSAAPPTLDDVEELVTHTQALQVAGSGVSSADEESVKAAAVGEGAWTRKQLVVRDDDGAVVAWPTVHDRAAGRTMVDIDVSLQAKEPDRIAVSLLAWAQETAQAMAVVRGLDTTQLDASVYENDKRLQHWLADAGYTCVRKHWQMQRPVSAYDLEPGVLPEVPDGLRVRNIGVHEEGMPVAEDLQQVHLLLEESFGDHFNSHRESFPEFVQRLREDPGHRWDHWWIAEFLEDDVWVPAGALVGSYLGPDSTGAEGSFVDYVGVGSHARGRGVGKAILAHVIRTAAERGCNRVGLEVDSDSPTNANTLYEKLGWQTKYVLQSWHKDVAADPRVDPPMMNDDRSSLEAWLGYFRATLDVKIAELTPVQLCAQPLPTTTLTLAGIVRHMAEVENYWAHVVVDGQSGRAGLYCDDDPNADFTEYSPDSVEADVANWHHMVSSARAIFAGVTDLDAPVKGTRLGQEVSLRWVMSHLATEYARHMGHADLLREAIDGRVGD